ncbi:MAG: ferritin-like domain-containing protein [Ginsengibacter sp.]
MKKYSNLLTAYVPGKPYQTAFNLNKASPSILKKINNLYGLLLQGKRKYEQIATITPDRDLRRTILSLAQESNQYACELSSQIQTLGGISLDEKTDDFNLRTEIKTFEDENKILNFCMANEKKTIKAYHEILNDSCLYEGLRSMFHYQLNGILCAFVQVKQLNSLKLHYSSVLS